MLSLLLACALPEPTVASPAPFHPPDAPGPWLAGTEEAAFVGPTGLDTPVQVWFPASEADEEPYVYDDILEGGAREDGVPACDTPRPVLVFSHGNSGVRYQSMFITELLATHGWVVVAPDHVGNTAFDYTLPLGEVALRRPLDAIAAYDWLVEMGAGPGGLLDGCVDPDAGYQIAGHSFGGWTALAVAGAWLDIPAATAYCVDHDGLLCGELEDAAAAAGADTFDFHDPRATAAVSMTPGGYEALISGLPDVAVPTLVLGGSLDTLTPMETEVDPIYRGLAVTPRMLGVVEGAGHFTFSDACAMLPTFEDCDPPYLSAEEAHPIISTVTTAFLMWTLGEEQALPWLPDVEEERLVWEEER